MKKIMILFVVMLFSAYFSSALSISTQEQRELTYYPGLERDFSFRISNADKKISTRLEAGELINYAYLEDNDSNLRERKIKLKLKFPNIDIPPGKYVVYAVAKEIAEGQQSMISALAEVKMGITLNALSHEKVISAAAKDSEISLAEPIRQEITVKSQTYKSINSVYATAEVISSSGQTVQTLKSKMTTLNSEEQKTILLEGGSEGIEEGFYTVKIKVFYDDNSAELSGNLKVGQLSVSLLDYTKEIIIGEINKVNIKVKNHFNKDIEDFYAVINLPGLEIKTSSIKIPKYETRTIDAYIDASSFAEGDYDSKIGLYFFGQKIEKNAVFNIRAKQKVIQNNSSAINLILVLGVIALIILIFTQLIYLRRNKRNENNHQINKKIVDVNKNKKRAKNK